MNRPVHRRVSGSDQDRIKAVTRVAVFMEFAMVRFRGCTTIPLIRRFVPGAATEPIDRVLTANMDRALSYYSGIRDTFDSRHGIPDTSHLLCRWSAPVGTAEVTGEG
ncbi:hypothetical protein DKT69_30680 [Micromonospora sicca]|uniref:Uncharacterized protein n=1 Tax=Micromonospora sicca TaxID=2202420 RepID=A0A317D4Q4_9ACTN|nr:hypothetical protein DKT69_30680 [Micromonospora sp. 4G51]